MHRKLAKYFENLWNISDSVRVTGREGDDIGFHKGLEEAYNLILKRKDEGRAILFIGNGGSAAIASHMAIDFWKNYGMKAHAFNDGSLLTCIGNDYGYPHVFEKPIEMFANQGDILVAISSSGRSQNILNGVDAARSKDAAVITLSGFDGDNPLSKKGDINFYVPSKAYGPVETIHSAICHCILDTLMGVEI